MSISKVIAMVSTYKTKNLESKNSIILINNTAFILLIKFILINSFQLQKE